MTTNNTAAVIAILERAVGLLRAAACPQCDGSGAFYDGHGEVHQCQWCCEVNETLAALAALREGKE